MSQTDRKYDGPTIQEKRLEAPKSPPPPGYRGVLPGDKKRNKGSIRHVDLYRWKAPKRSGWWWGERRLRFCPYVGVDVEDFQRVILGEYVIRRLRGILMEDKDLDVAWIESQDTKEQISPEFSSRECLLGWLEYEGLGRGYLYVRRFTYKRWFRKEQAFREIDAIRLEKTNG